MKHRGAQRFPGRTLGEHLLQSRSLWTSGASTGLSNAARTVFGKQIEQQKNYGLRKTGSRGKKFWSKKQEHKEGIGRKEELIHLLK